MVSNSERIPLDPRLHDAVKRGDMCLLEEFLGPKIEENHPRQGEIVIPVAGEAGAPLQHTEIPSCLVGVTHGGDTALHIAARSGHLEMAERICHENVSSLTKENAKIETPVHYAAKAGRREIVAFFIKLASAETSSIDLGELVRKRNRDGETALYQAILYNHSAVVKEFLNAAWNLNIFELASIPNNKNISPLYLAVMLGQLADVTSLIGSLPDSENVPRGAYAGPDGQTALHAAALRTEVFAQKLLDWKQDLAKSTDKSGSTALHYASSSCNVKVVRAIMENNKSCAYMADSSGLYPVHIAAKMGCEHVMVELFNQCPDMDELLDQNGRNFVHLAVAEQKETIVQWICSKAELAEVMNIQDNNGDTAMHLAVRSGHINIFARLLGTKRAHLGMTNKDGLTPRDLAISQVTTGYKHLQNPNLMMIRTLGLVSCCGGITRRDHFLSEYIMKKDKIEEEKVEDPESMAKSMAIGTVLIASAAFAATFSVSQAYKTDILAGHESPGSSLAFKSFVLMVAYAFFCSIIATCLLVDAALSILDPMFRWSYIRISRALITMATKGFVVAFAIGLYVVLTPVSKWLAILVCLAGAVMPVVTQPHLYPNILVTRALIRYLGWRGFFSGCLNAFWGNILFGIFVIVVLVGSLVPSRGAFPAVLVGPYGSAIILISISRFLPTIKKKILMLSRKGMNLL